MSYDLNFQLNRKSVVVHKMAYHYPTNWSPLSNEYMHVPSS